MKQKILFVSHPEKHCGVHEFGSAVAAVLKSSLLYDFIYTECGSLQALNTAISNFNPSLIIYNYHISTLPWLTQKIVHTTYKSLNRNIKDSAGRYHARGNTAESRRGRYHFV